MIVELNQPLQILRLRDVVQKVGLRRSTLYGKISSGEFPAPIKLGARASGWVCSEIDSWIAKQVAQRNQDAGQK